MATKAQHTLGPWAVSHNRPFNGTGACVRDSRGQMVADCFAYDQLDREREANARLIAAAPELLAALQDCIHYDDALRPEYKLPQSLRHQIEIAIAKARGE